MILEKLKKKPSDLVLLIAAAIGIIIVLTLNILVFEDIATGSYKYSILDFEFAWTEARIKLIFDTWGALGMALQAAGVYWDFLYIFGYAVPLFAMTLFFSRKLEDRVANIGFYMSLTPIIAGIFDLIENINLLIMLNNYASGIPYGTPYFESFVPLIASISATIKFGFLIVGAIFFLLALVLFLVKKIKKQD